MDVLKARRRVLALVTCIALALTFRCWGLLWGLYNADVSRRPHPDEWAIYWLFHWFDRTHSLNPCPSPQKSCFFDWGSVFPYSAYLARFVLSPVFALIPGSAFGPHADPGFVEAVLAGRLLSVLFSTLTIIVVYHLGKRAYGTEAGIAAALILTLSGLAIQLAHFATPDSTTTLLVSGTLLALLRAIDAPSSRRFVVAGSLIGLATGTEYHMALLSIPLATAWVLCVKRDARWLLGGLLAAGAGFLLSNPYALVDAPAFLAAQEHTFRIRTVDSGIQYQNRWSQYGPAWLYVVRYPLGYGLGFTLTAWLALGTMWSLLRRSRSDLLMLSWLVPYFLLVTLSTAKFMRYSEPLLPVLAVFGGRLFQDGRVWRPKKLGQWTVTTLAVLTLGYTSLYDGAYVGLFAATEPRVAATTWIQHHLSPGSSITFEELPNGLVNLPYFLASAGYRPCFAQFQWDRLAGPAPFVLLDRYTEEDHATIGAAAVQRFHTELAENTDYRLEDTIAYVPTFLGMSFSIENSPHDWRYTDHEITVYRSLSPHSSSPYCYPSIASASEALRGAPVAQNRAGGRPVPVHR